MEPDTHTLAPNAEPVRCDRQGKPKGLPRHKEVKMNEKMTSRANAATRRYLELRGFEILEQGWSHGTDTADFIAIDGESGDLVIVFAEVSRSAGEGFPDTEADRKAFERLAAAYLAETEYIDVTVRLDVVSLLVVGDDRALIRHCSNAAMQVG